MPAEAYFTTQNLKHVGTMCIARTYCFQRLSVRSSALNYDQRGLLTVFPRMKLHLSTGRKNSIPADLTNNWNYRLFHSCTYTAQGLSNGIIFRPVPLRKITKTFHFVLIWHYTYCTVICFVSISAKFGICTARLLLKLTYAQSSHIQVSQVRILASTRVPFRPTTVQMANLAL